MRVLVANTRVVTGDGASVLDGCSVVAENGIIADIIQEPYSYYDPADRIIDARGGFTIPGLINHHVHGLTLGPIQAICQPPLSESRVRYNLDRLLSHGITTALNVDGFPTLDEAEAVAYPHPVTVKATTLHTPTYLRWADSDRFGFGTLKDKHHTSAREMLARGAVAIGEAGPGSDSTWADFVLIPNAIHKKTGVRIFREQAAELRKAVETQAEDSVLAGKLSTFGLAEETVSELRDLVHATQEWQRMACDACQEAATLARELGVPFIVHNAAGTENLVRELADLNKSGLISGHSNLDYNDASQAIAVARHVKAQGGWVDIMAGDVHSGARFFKNLELHVAMLRAGVVDMMSTDYCGGFWDPMLLVLERCIDAGAVTLPQAVALVTGNVHKILPQLSPNRGLIEVGRVADLVITSARHISQLRCVIVRGEVVVQAPG